MITGPCLEIDARAPAGGETARNPRLAVAMAPLRSDERLFRHGRISRYGREFMRDHLTAFNKP
jgi:hypothetical protein